ncbi:MAG TPA: tetratricopeptide repeat protein [Gaiellaceae bacterium]|nr:tetratricopeptide repeat protein [Gaiellaceae bacterium]
MERKLATVLFVDLVGSTALVASADPEVVRRRVTRYFREVSHCVEAHGGVVEKFAGDAVLAAFGVPQAHEDDAERAIKAAFAILDQVHELGLEARIGIESGEVVVDDAESTFVTGEAVNVAARLQQQAGPGEVLIGPVARGLSFNVVDAEELGPVELKGLRDPIPIWRATCAAGGAARAASVRAPLIGRESELELLTNTYDRTVRDRRANLFTIYGEAGVGKSRLAREFVDGIEGATVLIGRCLPYGEGITYWPLAEMVKTVAGISDDDPIEEAFEKLKACCEDEAVADLLGLASGVLEALEGDRSPQEIAWAARAFVEKLAETQPVVLAFEDIHWAEEPLLELIEHLADWVRAPLLILCLARAELLEIHPGWGGGRVRATAIELEALGLLESEQLVEALLAEETGNLNIDVRRALLDKTEGNPLFVEETIRMVLDRDGAGGVERIPDSLQALIGARIDRLPPKHRSLIRRAAVIGRVFWVGALEYLSPDIEDVGEAIDDLLLRDFLLPETRSSISGEVAFRFKHVLIREVAFAGLSKSARADHHARFAHWLKEREGGELIEIRAYHLDHAVTLLEELDGEAPEDLSREAAAALAKAGRRALSREANRSGRKLLLRALELEPTLERRYDAARAAWRLQDLPAVSAEMERVVAEAAEQGDRATEGKALTALAEVALYRDADLPRAKELAEQAIGVLEPALRFRALMVCSTIARWQGEFDEQQRYVRNALELAQEIGRKDFEAQATRDLADSELATGRYDDARALADHALELAEQSGSIVARAHALVVLGQIKHHEDDLDGAQTCLEQARVLFSEAGATLPLGRCLLRLAEVASKRGDHRQAEKLLRESIRALKTIEDRGTLCESQRALADALLAQGKLDEAERVAIEAMETVGVHDVSSQATTRASLAAVLIAQDRLGEAERLLREAWDAVSGTGWRSLESFVLELLDQLLRDLGRPDPVVAERLAELAPAPVFDDEFMSSAERIA